MTNIDWTPALTARLLALRAEVHTPTRIGAMLSAEFGIPITIGMVTGKLNRLRMSGPRSTPPAEGRWPIGRLPRNACHYQTYPDMFCGRPSVGDQSYCPAHLQAIEAALGLSRDHPPEETTT
jgi:hypothetical protein